MVAFHRSAVDPGLPILDTLGLRLLFPDIVVSEEDHG